MNAPALHPMLAECTPREACEVCGAFVLATGAPEDQGAGDGLHAKRACLLPWLRDGEVTHDLVTRDGRRFGRAGRNAPGKRTVARWAAL